MNARGCGKAIVQARTRVYVVKMKRESGSAFKEECITLKKQFLTRNLPQDSQAVFLVRPGAI